MTSRSPAAARLWSAVTGLGRGCRDVVAQHGSVCGHGRDARPSNPPRQHHCRRAACRRPSGSPSIRRSHNPWWTGAKIGKNEFSAASTILINGAGISEPPGSSILAIMLRRSPLARRASGDTLFRDLPGATPTDCRACGRPHRQQQLVRVSWRLRRPAIPPQGAVNSLTLAIAAELKEHGVRAMWCVAGARTGCTPGAGLRPPITICNRRGFSTSLFWFALDFAVDSDLAAPALRLSGQRSRQHPPSKFSLPSGGFVGRFP